MCRIFQKVPLSTILYPSTFKSKTPSFGGIFVNKNTQNMKRTDFGQKIENLVKNTFVI